MGRNKNDVKKNVDPAILYFTNFFQVVQMTAHKLMSQQSQLI